MVRYLLISFVFSKLSCHKFDENIAFQIIEKFYQPLVLQIGLRKILRNHEFEVNREESKSLLSFENI